MRCQRGYCIACDKEIESRCPTCNHMQKNEHYTEVQVPWSNGSKMQMQCCIPCSKENVWKVNKQDMTEAVWAAWDKEGGKFDRSIVIV